MSIFYNTAGQKVISMATGANQTIFTASQYPPMAQPMATLSAYSGATTTTAGGSVTSYSMYISPMVVEHPVTFNSVVFLMSHATVAGTGSGTNAHMFGLYTNNAGTLSLVSSWHFEHRISQNSVSARTIYWFWGTNSTSNNSNTSGNVSASIAKMNCCLLHTGASSLNSGNYWLGYMQTMSQNAASIGSFSAMHVSQSQSTFGSMFGTNVSSMIDGFFGIYSRSTTGGVAHVNILPVSIHNTAVTKTGGSSQNRSNLIYFGSSQ